MSMLRRPLVVVLVVALIVALGGFFAARWWTGEGHRRHQAMERLQSVPGVAAVDYEASDRRAHVTLDRTASSTTIRGAIKEIARHADDDRLTVVLAVGPVHTVIVHGGEVSADLLAPALRALGSAAFLKGTDVEIGPVWDVDVRTAKSGTAITVAHKTIRALARAEVWSARLGRLRVHYRDNGFGDYDAVSVIGRDSAAAITALRRMQPLQSLHPLIGIGPRPRVSMAVNGIERAQSAYNQARRLMPQGAALDVTIGTDAGRGPRISGAADPAPAFALIRSMRSAGAKVSSVTADGRSVDVVAPSDALTAVTRALHRSGVREVTLDWRDGTTEKGSIQADVRALRSALPGLRRLQRAGYRVVWKAQDHSHLNDGPTIQVEALTDTTTGSPLDEADHGVTVMRTLRQLHWRGTAALFFAARSGDTRNRPSFLSTAAGRSRATPDPGAADDIAALRAAWDTSRRVA